MKKPTITLENDTDADGKPVIHHYMPGDTISGHLGFKNSSNLKYTCIKIRFVGLISTKVAKTSEEIYVLNQQVVIHGNANNTEVFVLQQGKHDWPFEFLIPLQHIPSSGKYRHGTVKYTLTATITSKSFLGNMQETKTNYIVHVKDLINCLVEPYSTPISIVGSSNTKPDTNQPENLAIATVQLSRSAFLKGETLSVEIDLSHPKKLQRDPGCWVQLIRNEKYHAGEQTKEYSHVIASSTHAISLERDKTGKILAELIIPDDTPPTMSTSKIMSIQYLVFILLDMRPKTGFLERKNRRNANKALRTKLLAAPGGFDLKIPIHIGTLADAQHISSKQECLENQVYNSDLNGSSPDMDGRVASLMIATSRLSFSNTSNSAAASPVVSRVTAISRSSSDSPLLREQSAPTSTTIQYSQPPFPPQTQIQTQTQVLPPSLRASTFIPQTQYRPGLSSRSSTPTMTGASSVNDPLSPSGTPAVTNKALPAVPNLFAQSQPSPQMSITTPASTPIMRTTATTATHASWSSYIPHSPQTFRSDPEIPSLSSGPIPAYTPYSRDSFVVANPSAVPFSSVPVSASVSSTPTTPSISSAQPSGSGIGSYGYPAEKVAFHQQSAPSLDMPTPMMSPASWRTPGTTQRHISGPHMNGGTVDVVEEYFTYPLPQSGADGLDNMTSPISSSILYTSSPASSPMMPGYYQPPPLHPNSPVSFQSLNRTNIMPMSMNTNPHFHQMGPSPTAISNQHQYYQYNYYPDHAQGNGTYTPPPHPHPPQSVRQVSAPRNPQQWHATDPSEYASISSHVQA